MAGTNEDWQKYFGIDKPEWKAPASMGASPKRMKAGGSIISRGFIYGDEGEEVPTAADVAVGKETTLAKINKMFSGASGGVSGGGTNINGPFNVYVQIDTVEKDADIDKVISRIGNEGADKLLFALRNKLENGSTRGIGYLRG